MSATYYTGITPTLVACILERARTTTSGGNTPKHPNYPSSTVK